MSGDDMQQRATGCIWTLAHCYRTQPLSVGCTLPSYGALFRGLFHYSMSKPYSVFQTSKKSLTVSCSHVHGYEHLQ